MKHNCLNCGRSSRGRAVGENDCTTPGQTPEASLAASRLVCGVVVKGGGGEDVFAYIHPDFDYLEQQGQAEISDADLVKCLRVELDDTTENLASYKRIVRFEVSREPFVKTSTKKIKRHVHIGNPKV